MKKEYIKRDESDEDWWICICGNEPTQNGFFHCNSKGVLIEPNHDSEWDGLYICNECGRIIKQDTLQVIGRRTIPAGQYATLENFDSFQQSAII